MVASIIMKAIGNIQSAVKNTIADKEISAAKKKEAELIGQNIIEIQKMIDEGKIESEAALKRIEGFFDDLGGKAKEHYNKQMELGMEEIESARQSAFDQLKFQLGEAKIRGDRSERDFIEQQEKKIEKVEKAYNKANVETRKAFVNRRLGASEAFMTHTRKSQESYGEVLKDFEETKSKFLRGIGEQFTDVVRAQGFQTGAITAESQRAQMAMRRGIGEQLYGAQERIGMGKFGATESERAREQARRYALGSELAVMGSQQRATEAELELMPGRKERAHRFMFGMHGWGPYADQGGGGIGEMLGGLFGGQWGGKDKKKIDASKLKG
jgi:hypothetical protein